MDKQKIIDLIQDLGVALADHAHVRSDELRKSYEDVLKSLEASAVEKIETAVALWSDYDEPTPLADQQP